MTFSPKPPRTRCTIFLPDLQPELSHSNGIARNLSLFDCSPSLSRECHFRASKQKPMTHKIDICLAKKIVGTEVDKPEKATDGFCRKIVAEIKILLWTNFYFDSDDKNYLPVQWLHLLVRDRTMMLEGDSLSMASSPQRNPINSKVNRLRLGRQREKMAEFLNFPSPFIHSDIKTFITQDSFSGSNQFFFFCLPNSKVKLFESAAAST